MTFTLKEWNFIKLCLETASRQYEKTMNESKVSDDKLSCYQIFKRQMEQANELAERIENTEI